MKNKTPIYNPLNRDITVGWDLNGRNPKRFKLVAKEITLVSNKYLEHVKKTLANYVFDALGNYNKDRQIQLKKFYKLICPKI